MKLFVNYVFNIGSIQVMLYFIWTIRTNKTSKYLCTTCNENVQPYWKNY